ncbi:MAG TPA: hypothetical protein VF424_02915 [Vicinamibacterales bacterium]
MTTWKLAAVLVGLGAGGTGAVLHAGFRAFLPWRQNASASGSIPDDSIKPVMKRLV